MIAGLPEKLKELRKRFGFSQQDVADRLGISSSIISGYETGERTPSTEVILSISYLYNCSTDYLLGKQSKQTVPMISLDGLTDEQIKAIFRLIDSMKIH